jgi:hypothetical protein
MMRMTRQFMQLFRLSPGPWPLAGSYGRVLRAMAVSMKEMFTRIPESKMWYASQNVCYFNTRFFWRVARYRKAAISLAVSVCPFVHPH